jgi:hypothetical protein
MHRREFLQVTGLAMGAVMVVKPAQDTLPQHTMRLGVQGSHDGLRKDYRLLLVRRGVPDFELFHHRRDVLNTTSLPTSIALMLGQGVALELYENDALVLHQALHSVDHGRYVLPFSDPRLRQESAITGPHITLAIWPATDTV